MHKLTTEAEKAAATLDAVADTLEQFAQPNQASECRERAEALRESVEDTCVVCGGAFPDDPDKFDPRAPVHADDYAYHLGCEDDVFDNVHAEA